MTEKKEKQKIDIEEIGKEEKPDLETESANVTAKETADFKERIEKAEQAVVEMKEKKRGNGSEIRNRTFSIYKTPGGF